MKSRYIQYLEEKIVTPPRIGLTMSKEFPFYEKRKKLFMDFSKQLQKLIPEVEKRNNRDGDDVWHDVFGSPSIYLDSSDYSIDWDMLDSILEKYSKETKSISEVYIDGLLYSKISVEWQGNLLRSIERYKEEAYYDIINNNTFKDIEKLMKKRGWDKGWKENYNDLLNTNEYSSSIELLKEIVLLIPKIQKETDYLYDKTKAMYHIYTSSNYTMDGKVMPFGKEDVETLYHASFQAKKLAREGFKKNFNYQDTERMQGLGGSVSIGSSKKDGISFTYDLYIAKEISRYFKEMAYIAQGKMKIDKLLDTIKRDRMLDDVLNYWQKEKLGGWFKDGKVEIDKIIKTEIGLRKKIGVETRSLKPEDLVSLYYVYRSLHPKLYNPVPWGLEPKKIVQFFKKNKASDIGIVVADVLLDDNTSFVSGEREFRVPAENVLKIKKVI